MPEAGVTSRVMVTFILFGLLGSFLAGIGALPRSMVEGRSGTPTLQPKPHLVSRLPGGTALRFSMIHDVIHQRFPKHGLAYHEARRQQGQAGVDALEQALLAGTKPSLEALRHFDDLGAALDKLHRSGEAASALERKAELLRVHAAPFDPPAERASSELAPDEAYEQLVLASLSLDELALAWYRTHANLGTFLIHGNFPGLLQGDGAARERVEAGLKHIQLAMRINPAAHFGREVWQARAVEHFLASLDDPQRMTRYDLAGNALAIPALGRARAYGRGIDAWVVPEDADPDSLAERFLVREGITLVGGDAYPPVPFDEPALAIVGMWLLGGGANPHFCLALGGIMERVGQRYIAWTAYARALELRERFSPQPDLRQQLVEHCESRQALIESQLPTPAEELQKRFAAELAFGEAYQEAYAAYEAEQLAAGADLDDPQFYAAFSAAHPEIATPPGSADYVQKSTVLKVSTPGYAVGFVLVGGLGSWLGLLMGWSQRRKTRQRAGGVYRRLDA